MPYSPGRGKEGILVLEIDKRMLPINEDKQYNLIIIVDRDKINTSFMITSKHINHKFHASYGNETTIKDKCMLQFGFYKCI